jgi:hypothetical protein
LVLSRGGFTVNHYFVVMNVILWMVTGRALLVVWWSRAGVGRECAALEMSLLSLSFGFASIHSQSERSKKSGVCARNQDLTWRTPIKISPVGKVRRTVLYSTAPRWSHSTAVLYSTRTRMLLVVVV